MQLQLIFDEIVEKKQKEKEIKQNYKDALLNANGYQEIIEKIKEFRVKKNQIEEAAKERMGKEWEKFEEMHHDLKVDKITLTDLAISDLMAGKTVEVEKDGIKYIPVWSVKFKKV